MGMHIWRRTNVQQLTCNIDLSCFFISFLIFCSPWAKALCFEGESPGEKFWKSVKNSETVLPFIGNENWTQTIFSQTFRAPPGYPSKIPGYPTKKAWFPWVSKDIPNLFGPHPFTWKTPTPPENIRTQKFGFVHFSRAWVGCTPRGSCNNRLLRRVLRRFFKSKCFLEGFLEGASMGFQ